MITKHSKINALLALALTLGATPLNAQTEVQKRQIEGVQAPLAGCIRRSIDELYASASDIPRSADRVLATCRPELASWRIGMEGMVQQPDPADLHYLKDKEYEARRMHNMIKSTIIYALAKKRCAAGLPAAMLDCASLNRPLVPPGR